MLRSKIVKLHGNSECLANARETLLHESKADSSMGEQRSAFSAMRREPTLDAAKRALTTAERRLGEAAGAEREARTRHEESKAAVEEVSIVGESAGGWRRSHSADGCR